MPTSRNHPDSRPPSQRQRALPLAATLLLLVVGLLAWQTYGAYHALVDLQQQLSRQTVSLISTEIDHYLDRLQHRDDQRLQQRLELLMQPAGADQDADRQLDTLPGNNDRQAFRGLAVAERDGTRLYQSPGFSATDDDLDQLRAFADNPDAPSAQLQNIDDKMQLSLLTRLSYAGGKQRILMRQYEADRLIALLDRSAAPGQRLLITDRHQPKRILLAAPGTTTENLSDADMALIAHIGERASLTNSHWQIVVLPDEAQFEAAVRSVWLRGGLMLGLALLFGALILYHLGKQARLQRETEHSLRETHSALKGKVKRRTQALTKTHAELAAQIDRRRKAEARMTMLSRAVEHTGDSVIVADREGVIQYANPAFSRLTGRGVSDILGTALADLQSAHQPSEFMRRLWEHLDKEHEFREIFCIRNAAGEPCYTEQTIATLRDSTGQVIQLIATGKDITERMDSEQRLSYLAHHDTLTGLPNRALMFDRLDHALARANRKDTLVALLFMDIDRFKTINDSLGHQAGDELLIAVAARLSDSVRRSDSIARLGGDEFVAILEDIRHPDEPVHVATGILKAIAQPLTLAGQEVMVSSSMGIAMYPEDGGDANLLLQCADAAMYRAKAQGGNTYNFYTADMTAEAQRRLRMESRLRKALENKEFRLLYQPRLSLSTDQITAVEALLRWQPPGEAMLTPADFMTVLEETGLIRKVGEWVFQQTCTDFVRVQSNGHRIRMACNLSAKQFGDADLVEIIDRTVLNQAMRPEDLELELTESLLTHDVEHATQVLAALHDRGVRISVDDFGTGYSSLNYLKRFPIDDLKVDQSFIRDLNDDRDDATIVAAIISLAHSLGLGAVAEGVETQAQLQTLGLLGCDEIQGMLVSEPLDIDALVTWLDHRQGQP